MWEQMSVIWGNKTIYPDRDIALKRVKAKSMKCKEIKGKDERKALNKELNWIERLKKNWKMKYWKGSEWNERQNENDGENEKREAMKEKIK